MVKGISRQIILIDSPDQKIFEQAIFILKDGQQTVTDRALLQEAKSLLHGPMGLRKKSRLFGSLLWAVGGAMLIGCVWLLTAVL